MRETPRVELRWDGAAVSLIGKGLTILRFDDRTRVTQRFSLSSAVWIPTASTPAEFSVEIALFDAAGELVAMPGGAGAQPQNLRIAQVVQISRPATIVTRTSARSPRILSICKAGHVRSRHDIAGVIDHEV
jgi:hypothetical protein